MGSFFVHTGEPNRMTSGAVHLGQVRSRLLNMAQESDPYPFISVVEDYLDHAPDDDQIRALAISALVKQRLVDVASDLARACPDASPAAPKLRDAVDRLAPQKGLAHRPWSTTDAIFAANLQAMAARGGEGERLAGRLESEWQGLADQVRLFEAADGNLLVRGRRSDGRGIWLPAALDFAGKTEAFANAERLKGQIVAPMLIDGVGIGLLVPRIHSATQHLFLTYGPAIYLVERNLRGLVVALRLHDWTAALQDERLLLYVGPDAWDDFVTHLSQDDVLPTPGERIALTPWPGMAPSPSEDKLQMLMTIRDEQFRSTRERALKLYEGRDTAYWAERFQKAGPDAPLRVLCVTSRFTTFLQYSMRDLRDALDRAGLQTRLLMEDRDHVILTDPAVMRAIESFQPDLVCVIDHHRHGTPNRFIENVPYVCWIQDLLPHLFTPDVGSRMSPLDFTIGVGQSRCVLECGYAEDRFLPCRVPISPQKFAAPADTSEHDPSLSCDVVYISHHSETPAALHDRLRGMVEGNGVKQLLDTFYEQTRPLMTSPAFNAGYDVERLLREAEKQSGVTIEDPAERSNAIDMYVRPLADRTMRHTTLGWVANWADASGHTLHIYGRGWDQHDRFSCYARGEAKHGQHLAAIARQAKINLFCGMAPPMHQRVLETVGAGGFILIRHTESVHCYTAEHAEIECYLAEHRITEPTQIPVSAFSDAYREALHKRCALTGREVPDRLMLSPAALLDYRTRRQRDKAHYYANLAFPDLERISFDTPESFAKRAEHFLAHPDERAEITRNMSQTVYDLFTYDALVPEVIEFVRDSLQRQAKAVH